MPNPLTAPRAFRLRSRLPAVVGAALLFAGAAAFFAFAAPRGAFTAALAGLSVIAACAALIAAVNLATHEGWAVVVGADAVELPRAPLVARRRDRIPYADIGYVGLTEPGAEPLVIIHVGPERTVRWVRGADLVDATAAEVAAELTARITAARGPGSPARATHT